MKYWPVVYPDGTDDRIAESYPAIIADYDVAYGIVQAGEIFHYRIFSHLEQVERWKVFPYTGINDWAPAFFM